MSSPALALRAQALSVPAFTGRSSVDAHAVNPELGRFAVAGAVDRTAHPGPFAQGLAEAMVVDGVPGGYDKAALAQRIAGARARWETAVAALRAEVGIREAVREAASVSAALLALEIEPAAGGKAWSVRGIASRSDGVRADLCLFVQRDKRWKSWPFTRSQDIPDSPGSFSSDPLSEGDVDEIAFELQVHTRLYVMTAELARFVIRASERRQTAFPTLALLVDQPKTFAAWVEALRQSGAIARTDVTLLAVDLGEPGVPFVAAPVPKPDPDLVALLLASAADSQGPRANPPPSAEPVELRTLPSVPGEARPAEPEPPEPAVSVATPPPAVPPPSPREGGVRTAVWALAASMIGAAAGLLLGLALAGPLGLFGKAPPDLTPRVEALERSLAALPAKVEVLDKELAAQRAQIAALEARPVYVPPPVDVAVEAAPPEPAPERRIRRKRKTTVAKAEATPPAVAAEAIVPAESAPAPEPVVTSGTPVATDPAQ